MNYYIEEADLAYFLYCLSEKLRKSDKLDEYDEQFLDVMLTSRLYCSFIGVNKDRVEMMVDAFIHYSDRTEEPERNWPF